MLKILDIRSSLFRTAQMPTAWPYRHVAGNDKPEGDVSALAERWMR